VVKPLPRSAAWLRPRSRVTYPPMWSAKDLAGRYKVSVVTLDVWSKLPGFPRCTTTVWKSGSVARVWDVEQVDMWHAARVADHTIRK
jgi:hypothetical protein